MNIACVGDCDVDRYVDAGIDRPGGITLNFAVHARRLFRQSDRVTVVTAVGTDREGQLVVQAIDRAGLDACLTRTEGVTPVQYIRRLPSGERQFVKYVEGVLATYRMGDRERAVIAASDLLMTPVYSQVVELFESVMASPSRGLRAVDFSDLADFDYDVGFVGRYASKLDIGFFGLNANRERLISDLSRLARETGRLFVVTLAEEGSLALVDGEPIRCAAEPVERIVDTTGAGDSFAAGFLCMYCETRDVDASLKAGSREAARTIQRVGGSDA